MVRAGVWAFHLIGTARNVRIPFLSEHPWVTMIGVSGLARGVGIPSQFVSVRLLYVARSWVWVLHPAIVCWGAHTDHGWSLQGCGHSTQRAQLEMCVFHFCLVLLMPWVWVVHPAFVCWGAHTGPFGPR